MEFGKLSSSLDWQRFNGQKIRKPLTETVEEILINELQAGYTIKVCIGSDSQVKGDQVVFATAIVFRRENKGAFMLTHKISYEKEYTIKKRMVMEANDSVEVGLALNDLLEQYNIEMEIHADVNTDIRFKSNVAFKDVMGYVLGLGWTFVPKPDAFASSNCADKVVKGGSWPKKKKAA